MLSEHECYHGLGMSVLVSVCSQNMNVTMVWAWMHYSNRMLSKHVRSRKRNVIIVWSGHRTLSQHERFMVWPWTHWTWYALKTPTFLRLEHGCTCDGMSGLVMDALVTVCSQNANVNVTMVWDGCSGNRMLSEHEYYYGFGIDALGTVCSRNTYALERRTLYGLAMDALDTVCLQHQRYSGRSMAALVTACMAWPWRIGHRMLWFGHECTGNRMLSKHEQYYGFGMDALVPYALGTRTSLWLGMDALV